MTTETIILSIIFISSIVLGVYAIYKNPKKKLNKIFFIFMLAIAIATLTTIYSFTTPINESKSFWNRIINISSWIVVTSGLHFILIFTKNSFTKKIKNFLLLYSPLIIFSILNLEIDFPVITIINKNSSQIQKLVQLSSYGLMILYSILGIVFCYKFSKKAKETEKKQAKLLILAIIIPIIGGILAKTISQHLGFQTFFLFLISLLISFIILVYMIIKYKFLSEFNSTIQKKILAIILSIVLLGSGITLITVNKITKSAIQEQVYLELGSVSKNKLSWINEFLEDRKNNIKEFSQSPTTIKMLDNQKTMNNKIAKENIKKTAEKVKKEVEEYLKSHPDMTLKDLQESAEFQQIAVQPVGKTGYTALTDYNSLICRFHKNPKIINLDLSTLSEKLPGFWTIMSKTKGGKDSEGFYEWEEKDKTIKDKYMYVSVINQKTKDNVGLTVAATTYLDEYESTIKILKESEDYLNNFKKIYDYENLYLIKPNGKIWWTTNKKLQGLKINNSKLNNTQLFKIFQYSKKNKKIKISDYEFLENKTTFFISKPIILKNKLEGIIVIEINSNKINKILFKIQNFGMTYKNYLINKERYMLTPLGYKDNTFLRKKIKTEITEKCLENQTNPINKQIRVYRNYNNIKTLGIYHKIPDTDWCLITEITEKEALYPLIKLRNSLLIIYVIFTIFGIALGVYFSRKTIKPIESLKQGIKKIEKGNLNIKVGTDSLDEIGELSRSFDKMAKNLKKSQEKLLNSEKKRRQELEKEVQKKTKELHKKVQDLKNTKKAILNMMEDLSQANKELKNLDKAKSEFLNIVSHELKTPLTALMAHLEVLDDLKNNLTKEELQSLEAIRRNSNNLKMLISNILEIARMESGKFELTKNPTDLEELIKNSVEELKILSSQKGLKLIEKIEKLPKINLDDSRIQEVLNNLITNAIKFTEKGSITITAKKKKDFVEVSVEDTGVGIPKDKIKNLFQKFYQVDASISRRYGGTGLGLSITKKIIEAHGGRISVISKDGKGTKFTFTIPLKSKIIEQKQNKKQLPDAFAKFEDKIQEIIKEKTERR